MRIMITGGAGFIGSHLAEFLIKKNHKIIIVTKKNTKNITKFKNRVKIEKIDITDFNRIKNSIKKNKPDILVHLAGNTSHSKSFESPLEDIDANTKSVLNILEILRKFLPKCKFILGSTFVVVGKPQKLPIDENTPCNPTTIYGVNKLASEYYCKIYHRVFNLNTIIFRITNSFGPREQTIPNKNAINYLIHQAHMDKDITIYDNGKFYRDLIYVTDVISAIYKIMNKGKPGELYWISSNKRTWFYELGKMLATYTNAKVRYVPSPKYTKKVDVGNFIVNNKKLKSLGWYSQTSVKDGIKETLKYFEKENI